MILDDGTVPVEIELDDEVITTWSSKNIFKDLTIEKGIVGLAFINTSASDDKVYYRLGGFLPLADEQLISMGFTEKEFKDPMKMFDSRTRQLRVHIQHLQSDLVIVQQQIDNTRAEIQALMNDYNISSDEITKSQIKNFIEKK